MNPSRSVMDIGTNRNILGGMIAQFAQAMTQAGLTYDQVWDIVNAITNGEVPAFSAQESRPMIIRVNPATSETKVIYEAPLGTDSAYRMVVKYHNELYFGSMSSSSGTRLVKIDETTMPRSYTAAAEIPASGRARSTTTSCISVDLTTGFRTKRRANIIRSLFWKRIRRMIPIGSALQILTILSTMPTIRFIKARAARSGI